MKTYTIFYQRRSDKVDFVAEADGMTNHEAIFNLGQRVEGMTNYVVTRIYEKNS